MESTKKQYWKGLEELTQDPEFVKHANKEFPEYLPTQSELDATEEGATRRDFLKLMGFGMAAVTLASCEAPIRNAIPYVNKPVDVDPGIPNYYASTYMQGSDYCSIVVKTREGRPIKIEGNELSAVTQGGTNTQVQASVLSLYDKERLTSPQKQGVASDWATIDKEITRKLADIAAKGGQIRLISNTIISPTALKAIDEFKAKYGNVELIQYDTQSAYGLTQAHNAAFGVNAVPSYHFEKADTIVSFDADFLGTWISPIEYTKGYSKGRKIGPKKKTMSRHYQFETNLSLTGANADYRTAIKPSEQGKAVIALYNAIASKTGGATLTGTGKFNTIEKAANELLSSKGKSIVVSGSNDPAIQAIIVDINAMLSNYGATITLYDYANNRKGNDAQITTFIEDATAGKIDAAIFLNSNPVYNHPQGAKLATALKKIALTVSTSDRKDETASQVTYIAPNNHYLESWGDAEPKKGQFSLMQPTISPIFDTRQQEESILRWSDNTSDYFSYLKSNWQATFGEGKEGLTYQSFWDKCLQDGVFVVANQTTEPEYSQPDVTGAAATIAKNYKGSGLELALYQKVAIGDGTQANNPWLQETPDPIAKTTWDNYVTVSMADARALGIKEYEGKSIKVDLTVNGKTHRLPVVIQPGQAIGTLGLALGYGRTAAGRVGNNLGFDANGFISSVNGANYYAITSGVDLKATDEEYQVARTQTHQTYMDRGSVIQEATLKEYQKDPMAGREVPMIATWQDKEHGKVKATSLSLWKGHEYPDHHWGLAIDMNSCTGCSACHVSCVAENNIPVVGRQEVINRRDMHWMRIDRYYSSNEEAVAKAKGKIEKLRALDMASENPEVTFQPMMCQHCNNAGCETVCPVAATSHSTEGLNQMVYNRCIGTRYCANNCAYKVRRFNWFKYHDNKQFDKNLAMNNDLGKMVLNPDVTVRSRGVMEKCTMCVQRIQYGKLEAKKDGRRPNDGDFTTACAAACPSDAIVFGDMNDDNSNISQLLKIKNIEGDYGIDKQVNEARAYTVLEETGSKPNVLYLTKIRNKDKEESHA